MIWKETEIDVTFAVHTFGTVDRERGSDPGDGRPGTLQTPGYHHAWRFLWKKV